MYGIAATLALLACGVSGAEPPEPRVTLESYKRPIVPPEERNAAIAHGLAWSMYMDDLLLQLESVPLRRGELPEDWVPDEALSTALEDAQWLVKPVLKAATMRHCDFELAYEDGASLLLPHIGRLRQDTEFLLADARRLEQEGSHGEAASRIAGVFGIARHLAHDGIYICSGVSMDLAGLAADEAARLAPNLDAAARASVLEQMDLFDERDPFGNRAAVVTQVEHTFANSALDIAGARRERIGAFTTVQIPDEPTKPSTEVEQRFVDEQLDACRRWAADVLSAWEEEDGGARLRGIQEALEKGEYGTLAQKSPGINARPFWVKERASLERMNEARALLAGDGEAGEPAAD